MNRDSFLNTEPGFGINGQPGLVGFCLQREITFNEGRSLVFRIGSLSSRECTSSNLSAI